jgi:hypothetical protein
MGRLKGDVQIELAPGGCQVNVQDTHDPKLFFVGYYPPTMADWVVRDWEVMSHYEKPTQA